MKRLLFYGLVSWLFIRLIPSAAYAETPPPQRALYGGVPKGLDSPEEAADYGLDAVFIAADKLTPERVSTLQKAGLAVYAEFNSMHHLASMEGFDDLQPVGPDGQVLDPPHGWRGVCPTHSGYHDARLGAFREVVSLEITGVWLDYHHAQASWERTEPLFQESCYCERCLAAFAAHSGLDLPQDAQTARDWIRAEEHESWLAWRAGIYSQWVADYRAVIDEVQPGVVLASFVPPYGADDYDGALYNRLAIDLEAQGAYLDALSPMLYQTRFGHAGDAQWASNSLEDLAQRVSQAGLGLELWPIVQISDWGGEIEPGAVADLVAIGAHPAATGVIVFKWGSLRRDGAKLEALWEALGKLRANPHEEIFPKN